MATKVVVNVQRVQLTPDAQPLNANFSSDIIDYRDMLTGFIQVIWNAPDTFDGFFELWVSAFPDAATMGKYPGSKHAMDADCNSFSWNIQRMGFRYAMVKWTKGTQTTGSVFIVGTGKLRG